MYRKIAFQFNIAMLIGTHASNDVIHFGDSFPMDEEF